MTGPEVCWMCGAPGVLYIKGFLCDEHAQAQGIKPQEKRVHMSFAGQAEAAESQLALVPQPEPQAEEAPWSATVGGNYERISVTFKHGPGYDEPWVVFKAHSVGEVSELIKEFRGVGGFAAVATVAAEFKGSGSVRQDAVAVVQTSMPGATVVPQVVPQPQAAAPQQSLAVCDTCGAPTTFKEGTGKNGKPYAMYKCNSNGDHVRWLR